MKLFSTRSLSVVGAAAAAFCLPAHAQFVTLTDSGTPILSTINPKFDVSPQPATCTNTGSAPTETVQTQSSTLATAKFNGLPGSTAMPGYASTAYRSATATLSTGSPAVTVGTVYDRVYCTGTGSTCDGTNNYVFATRAILNTNPWNNTGQSFEINDFFRVVPTTATVQAGYYMGKSGDTTIDNGQAFKFLEYAGRTQKGLGQTPVRDNGYVAFRADNNANDPDRCEPNSSNSARSPWLYAKLSCPNGIGTATQTFKIKVREGGEELQQIQTISINGFVCN